jgi:hypothetical protein
MLHPRLYANAGSAGSELKPFTQMSPVAFNTFDPILN